MPTSLTRETFISPDHIKVAAAHSIMFKDTADGEGIEEVPVPASVRETGIIPDGYSVDFILDPSTVVSALKKQEIVTVEQLPAEAVKSIMDTINAPENLRIVPTKLHTQKRELEMQAAEE